MKKNLTMLCILILTIFMVVVAAASASAGDAAPVADFTVNVTSGEAPLSVQFTDNSTGATNWSWDFGDETAFSIEVNPVHTYTSAGTYSVILTVTNATTEGSDTATASIEVSSATASPTEEVVSGSPVANFTANVTSGKAPFTVTFTDLSTGAESWSWDFDGDGVEDSNLQNPEYTFYPGNYTVDLTVSNSVDSVNVTKEDYIQVIGPYSTALANENEGAPDPAIPMYIGPEGDGVYDTSSDDNVNYRNPIFVARHTSVVDYSPSATISGGTLSLGDLTEEKIAAGASPGEITVWFEAPICNGEGADFVSTENAFLSDSTGLLFAELGYVEVSTDGEYFARFPSVSYTPERVGDYGGIDSRNVYNLVGKHVAMYGDYWGTPFDLDDLADDPGVLNGSIDLNEINYVKVIDIPGSGDFKDSLGNPIYDAWPTWGTGGLEFGGIDVIYCRPAANFTADETTGSGSLIVQFNDTSTGGPATWSWDFGDGSTSSDQNPVHEYVTNGTYTVSLSVTNDFGNDTEVKTGYITIDYKDPRSPVVDFTADPVSGAFPLNVQFNDSSTGGPTAWLWDFGDGNTSTEQNPVHEYADSGKYTVKLTATNEYGSSYLVKTDYITPYGVLADTAWPKLRVDEKNSGISPYNGPQTNNTVLNITMDVSFNLRSFSIGSDGTIYFGGGDSDDNLHALNPDGTEKWIYTTGDGVHATPAISSDGTIYFGSYDKSFYALNPDGTLKWSYTTDGTISGGASICSNGNIYFGSSDKNFYALNPDGTLNWYLTTSGIPNSPAIGSDGTVYVASTDGTIYSLNPDGTEKWNVSTGGNIYSSPVLDSNDVLYVGNMAAKILAIDPDGTEKWNYTAGGYGSFQYSSPIVGTDGTVYIGANMDMSDVFLALNPNGTLKWSCFESGGGFSGSPVMGADGTIYICEKYFKTVYAINPDGTYKWTYATGSSSTVEGAALSCTPAIGSDGTLYIGTETVYDISGNTLAEGRLYAFRDAGDPPVANFTVDITSDEVPLLVSFIDTSENAESWSWDFNGDGTVDSTEQNPKYTYASPGNYTVTLTVGNTGGSNTTTIVDYITVLDAPTSSSSDEDTWYQFMKTAEHTGYSASDAPDTNTLLWQSSSLCDNFSLVPASSVAVGDGMVFANAYLGPVDEYGNPEEGTVGQLVAFSIHNGRAYWNTTIAVPQWGSWSSPVYDDGYIFTSTGPNTTCVNATTGAIKWTFTNPSGLASCNGGPVIAEGIVLCSDWNGLHYYCLNEDTGSELWNFTVDSSGSYTQGTPAISNGTIILTSWADIYCLDMDGNLLWTKTKPESTVGNICGSPTIVGNMFYLTTYDFGNTGTPSLFGFNLENGTEIWNATIQTTDSTPAVADGYLYVCGGCHGYVKSQTYCFDASDGTLIWNTTQENDGIGDWTCSVAVADGKVFVGKPAGSYMGQSGIYALDIIDGSVVWQSDYAGGSPAIVADTVFSIGMDSGVSYLYAFKDKESGGLVANFTVDITSGEAPLSVSFTDESTGNPSSWYWDFGDGGTSTDENPSYTYTTVGEYSVNLTVTNSNGSDSLVKSDYITVTPFPVPDPSDTVVFQNDLYHTGVISQAGPIEDPELTWSAQTGSMNTDPLIISGLEVSACSGNLSVHNRTTGECIWYNITGSGGYTGAGSNLGAVCYGNGTIFFPEAGDGALSAFDLTTGKRIWRVSGLGGNNAQMNTPVVYDDHRIYFGSDYGNPDAYYCYYDNGTQCWNYTGGSGYYWAGAAVIGDYLVFGGESKNITSLNKYTGELVDEINAPDVFLLSSESQIRSSVTYDESSSRCYFTTVSGYCCGIGFDNSTGKFDTTNTAKSVNIGRTTSTPAIYKGRLYVGVGSMYNQGDKYLYCLDASNLTEIWKYTANGIVQSSPTVSTYYENSTGSIYIYFTTNVENGTAYCLRDYAGNTNAIEAWHWTPPASMQQYVLGGAVIKEGYLYFGNNGNGYTFALTGSGSSPVIADFTADPTSGYTPLTVQFTDTSSGIPTNWSWSFGDGSTSAERDPVHTYTSAGNYTVTLNASNSLGSDEKTVDNCISVINVPAGNWEQFQVNSYHNGVTGNIGPEENPGIKWKFDTGSSIDVPAVVNNGTIYTMSADGSVRAINLETGNLIWSNETSSGSLQSSTPVYGDGRLFVATFDGDLWCFDALEGTLLWNEHVTDGNFECPITYSDHKVYIGDGLEGGVTTKYYYCYDENGTFQWKHAAENSAGFIWSGASAVDGHLVYTTPEGILTSLNASSGDTIDEKSLLTEFSFSQSDAGRFRSSVSYSDGYVYTTSESSPTLGYCFKVKLNTNGTFSDDGWSTLIGFSTSTPAIVDGKVYVGEGEHGYTGALYCLNDSDGAVVWHVDTDAGIKSSPAVSVSGSQNRIYFTSSKDDGELYCVDSDGETLWTFNAPGDTSYVLQGAVLSGDVVLYGSDAGYLYCIEGNEEPEPPVTSFTAENNFGRAPLNVSFIDESTGYGIYEWLWDFGDGNISNETNPCHVYGENGLYTVSLTVTNSGGNNTSTRPGFVNVTDQAEPVVDFTYSASGTLSPVSVVFTDTSTNTNNATVWTWSFGDGITSNLRNPTHQYSEAGTYSVTLNVSNQYGSGEITKSNIITVEPWVIPPWATDDSWSQFQNDAQHTGFSEGSAPSISTRLWVSDDIGAVGSSSVVVSGGRIFVNCNDSTSGSAILSLNQQTGAFLGNHGEGNIAWGSWSSPAYNDSKVWCGLNDYPVGTTFSTVNGGTMVADGKVFSSNWDGGQYFCFNETTGEELWNYSVSGSYAQSCPAYKDGRVYVLYWSGEKSIYCLNADTGAEIWKQDNIITDPCGSPMITGDTVYFTTYNFYGDGALYAINIDDGSIRWNTSIMRSDSTPAYAYGNVYVCGGCANFSNLTAYCINATTGDSVWETDPADNIGSWTCSPAVADGKVYVGTSTDYTANSGITCLDAYTGEIIWQDEGGGSTPAIVDETVYSVGSDGRVYAYSASQQPVADFTASSTYGYAPMSVKFTDTSTGNVTGWVWEFGDGTGSTEESPSHTYSAIGQYTAKLTVTNSYGNSSKTTLITVGSRGGGGGSSSGSTSVVTDYTTTGALSTSTSGVVDASIEVFSTDEKAALLISSGTTALTAGGTPLSEVTIDEVGPESAPSVSSGTTFVFKDLYFSCTPEGATFSPSIDMVFQLTEEEFNSLEPGQSFSLQYYDEAAGQWIEIPTTLNTNTFQVIGEVSHFSTYALMVEEGGVATVSATPTHTATTTPTAIAEATTATATPSSAGTGGEEGVSAWVWLLVIVIIIVVIGAGLWYYNNKK